jgi:hypothetical protein
MKDISKEREAELLEEIHVIILEIERERQLSRDRPK